MKFLLNLRLFDFTAGTTAGTPTVNPVNRTSDSALSPTMKEFYDTTLLENAKEEMVFTQFGKKQPMKGNKCEWRKFNTFAKAMTPLTEGVIPSGKTFGMSKVECATTQHGDYTAVSDRLELESFDDVIYGATEEMGTAEGETYDTLTRNALIGGTNVVYAPNGDTAITSRTNITTGCVITPALINKIATQLKKNKAPKIDGYYVALIHPDVALDLKEDPTYKEYHKYNAVEPIFKGEIGEMHGVRFIETNNAKIWAKGTGGSAVYATLFLGKDAFGVLDPEGEGMEMIVKPKGTIGGPLEQFSTIGYKFCHGAKILYEERIVRLESGSKEFGATAEAN